MVNGNQDKSGSTSYPAKPTGGERRSADSEVKISIPGNGAKD